MPDPVVASNSSGRSSEQSDRLLDSMWSENKNETISLKVDVDENIPEGKLSNSTAVAVVIGNSSYQGGMPNVDYAVRDAMVMRQYLIRTLGYDKKNIIFEKNVTSGDFRNIFGSPSNPQGKLHNYARKNSEVFIYYSGHGAPGPDGKAAYLVPVDAKADYIANNGYPVDFFYTMIEKLNASKVTVVLDACFSGDSGGGQLFEKISPALVKNIRAIKNVKNCTIFSAADKDQVSVWHPEKRHGLFTYYFLKGLSGAADKSKNKQITVAEMKTYLHDEVSYWAQRIANRKQTPLVTGDENSVLTELR